MTERGGASGMLRRMRRGARPVAAALLVTLASCFRYVPAAELPAEPGTEVRLHLRQPVDARLLDVSPNNIVRIRGELVRAGENEVVVSVFGVTSSTDREWPGVGETIRLDRGNIGVVELRRFDALRTAGLVGIVVVGTLLTSEVIGVGGGGGEQGNGGRTQ